MSRTPSATPTTSPSESATDLRFAVDRVPRGRRVLQANAVFSAIGGGAGIVLAGPVADLLEVHAAIPASVGVGLVAYAVTLALMTRRREPTRQELLSAVVADVGWVLGSGAIAAGLVGDVSVQGRWFLVALAVPVAGFALAQWRATRA